MFLSKWYNEVKIDEEIIIKRKKYFLRAFSKIVTEEIVKKNKTKGILFPERIKEDVNKQTRVKIIK